MKTGMYRMNKKHPSGSTENYVQYPIISHNGKEHENEYMCVCVCVCVCVTESLCCAAVVNTTL